MSAPRYEFTTDWFSGRIPVWEEHLVPHCAGRPVRLLEVGSYEGRSAVWIAERLLGDPGSRLVCLDTWTAPEVEQRFQRNLARTGRGAQVLAVRGSAQRLLRLWPGVTQSVGGVAVPPPAAPRAFDAIYLDADHRGAAKLELAALCWPLLVAGGLLIWDDYARATQPHDAGAGLPPRAGIDAFCALWAHELESVHTGWQRIVRRRG